MKLRTLKHGHRKYRPCPGFPNVTVPPQTSDQFEKALGRYDERIDKNWSLTDCASFLTMEAEGIEAALSHDRHFAQAGFQAFLRRPRLKFPLANRKPSIGRQPSSNPRPSESSHRHS